MLNKRLYTGKELAKGVASLESRPAPAGHPKDSKGRHISASNGEALDSSWIGAWCVNSRYEGGRALCDTKVNAAQASALPAGKEVVARLGDAVAGTNTDPIGVSRACCSKRSKPRARDWARPTPQWPRTCSSTTWPSC